MAMWDEAASRLAALYCAFHAGLKPELTSWAENVRAKAERLHAIVARLFAAASTAAFCTVRRLRSRLRIAIEKMRARRTALTCQRLEHDWQRRRPGRPHGLPGRLLISLTSYPPRFATLDLTLRSLLVQSIEPNAVLLWIAHGDLPHLPEAVRRLAADDPRLQIQRTADLGPYKKFVPARTRFTTAFLALADDDAYYEPRWLETLVRAFRTGHCEIPCGRAHELAFDGAGKLRSYADWRHNIPPGPGSPHVFPTGVGGILLPPRCLDPMACEATLFQQLCPTGDDIWLYWMARRAGWCFRKVGARREPVCWEGTQETALHWRNAGRNGRNDAQIARMCAEFGHPWRADFAQEALGPFHSLRLQRA